MSGSQPPPPGIYLVGYGYNYATDRVNNASGSQVNADDQSLSVGLFAPVLSVVTRRSFWEPTMVLPSWSPS